MIGLLLQSLHDSRFGSFNFQWRNRNLSSFIKNIFFCILIIHESLRCIERHELMPEFLFFGFVSLRNHFRFPSIELGFKNFTFKSCISYTFFIYIYIHFIARFPVVCPGKAGPTHSMWPVFLYEAQWGQREVATSSSYTGEKQ